MINLRKEIDRKKLTIRLQPLIHVDAKTHHFGKICNNIDEFVMWI